MERQLELAEDLVGFATDERRVDVARGVALLQGMVARWAQCRGVKTGLLFAAVSVVHAGAAVATCTAIVLHLWMCFTILHQPTSQNRL